MLIVAPMSGHYATLLRGTVEAMLPHADVYITDWTDARMVPVTAGEFDLDDYIDYLVDIFHELGPDTHVMAVCQPSVPVLAAVAMMEVRGRPLVPPDHDPDGRADRHAPANRRRQPAGRGSRHRLVPRQCHHKVPWPTPGFMRDVYPGFLQLSGFMSMNLDRHIDAHRKFFMHLVKGDGDAPRSTATSMTNIWR